MQTTEPFNISIDELLSVVNSNGIGTTAIAGCSVLNEKLDVDVSSVEITAVKFLQHDFSFSVSLESHVPPQVLFLPKKLIAEITFPQKCIFTDKLLVATSSTKIHNMEMSFFML